ncbi:MAG: SDR family NAD(P)-dependent oxidoreductase [Beijerinckiaceae bacterium]
MASGANIILAGRHALVTGGGRGIGRAVARALVDAGATVTVAGRTESHLQDAVAKGDAHGYLILDVTEETAVLHAVRKAAAARGPIDILVANAGAAESGPFLKTDSTVFHRMLNLNLMGVVHACHAVLPDMVTRGHGRIIAIASTAGLKGYAYVSAYTAAKHAVVGFTKALALETAASGVTVNAVCPGYTQTDLVDESLTRIAEKTGRSRDAALNDILKDKPLKRLIKPEEVAAACVWLACDAAAAVTGTSLVVAGGEI